MNHRDTEITRRNRKPVTRIQKPKTGILIPGVCFPTRTLPGRSSKSSQPCVLNGSASPLLASLAVHSCPGPSSLRFRVSVVQFFLSVVCLLVLVRTLFVSVSLWFNPSSWRSWRSWRFTPVPVRALFVSVSLRFNFLSLGGSISVQVSVVQFPPPPPVS